MYYNDPLYTKTLTSNNDINKYVTDLLLSLLGYYKNRNIKNRKMTKIDFNIITPTLVKKYNPLLLYILVHLFIILTIYLIFILII